MVVRGLPTTTARIHKRARLGAVAPVVMFGPAQGGVSGSSRPLVAFPVSPAALIVTFTTGCCPT